GQTLEATALVHEAYLRLVASPGQASPGRESGESEPHWNGRGHFFAAAAKAMRRILVDQARRQQAHKRAGRDRRLRPAGADVGYNSTDDRLLDIDDALARLAAEDPQAARLIQLRYFAGLSIEDAAELVGIARSTAYEHWSFAKVRLKTLLDGE